MGTVGLSFGSPTSGAGFNVSTTVAEIVSNLQNVESPWKSQLTALQSQDTAISSLGTLFSSLSNDLSSLTDFQGVTAMKEGSSSNPDVLTLTAADNTAIAGTHTVTVTNLAQTSSGYLTPIANANDALSGSITLQGPSGTQLNITLNSSDNTLTGLAKTINSAGLGINASVLTDSSGSRLSLVSSTSGTAGDISVTNSAIVATNSTAPKHTSASGSATYSTGSLTALANTSDTLSCSISVAVGSGQAETIVIGAKPAGATAAHTIYTGSGNNTLSDLQTTIQSNPSILGFTASIVESSSGAQSLALTSSTANSSGTLTVASKLNDVTGTTSLAYFNPIQGADANLSVDGVALTSASNTVANLIPGVTFQLLAPSAQESGNTLQQVQVVIANNNAGVESTVSQTVSDYNALISAINSQEGLDSTGKAEPLFGSPTLSLLQQQLMSGLNLQSPTGTLTAISTTTNTTLAGSMSITVGNGTPVQVIVGAGTNTANTIYTGSGVNTLSGLAAAINAAGTGTILKSTVTMDSGSGTSSATLSPITSAGDPLAGSISIQVGSGTAENIVIGAKPASPAANTIYTGSGVNTLSALAGAISSAGIGVSATVLTALDGVSTLEMTSGTAWSAGTLKVNSNVFAAGFGVTADVVTLNGQSTLTLASQTASSSGGALTVTSGIVATSDTPLSFATTAGTEATKSSAISSEAAGQSDRLSGSISIQVGSGPTMTVNVPSSPNNTLSGLAQMIGEIPLGVTASVVENQDGSYGLSLSSPTLGSGGDLTVTSNILDATNTSSATLGYTASSDISSLTTLGIGVNNDGSLTFDATSLDSVLNTDYSGVVGFFQNASSWGQSFNTMLTNSGTSSPTGILALSSSSNSNIESTLNANISREESLISAQQISLTAELNSANEIMQQMPTQLQGVNELYSAITGYNQNSNG